MLSVFLTATGAVILGMTLGRYLRRKRLAKEKTGVVQDVANGEEAMVRNALLAFQTGKVTFGTYDKATGKLTSKVVDNKPRSDT